jgi:hypothetical protein
MFFDSVADLVGSDATETTGFASLLDVWFAKGHGLFWSSPSSAEKTFKEAIEIVIKIKSFIKFPLCTFDLVNAQEMPKCHSEISIIYRR